MLFFKILLHLPIPFIFLCGRFIPSIMEPCMDMLQIEIGRVLASKSVKSSSEKGHFLRISIFFSKHLGQVHFLFKHALLMPPKLFLFLNLFLFCVWFFFFYFMVQFLWSAFKRFGTHRQLVKCDKMLTQL